MKKCKGCNKQVLPSWTWCNDCDRTKHRRKTSKPKSKPKAAPVPTKTKKAAYSIPNGNAEIFVQEEERPKACRCTHWDVIMKTTEDGSKQLHCVHKRGCPHTYIHSALAKIISIKD